METFNGNVSNNDFKIVNNEILKIGATDPSKGTIEFITNKPYDRIQLRFSSGVGLNGNLRVYYAYQLERIYASSETHGSSYCPNCTFENPQNAVGPNEIDYSKLTRPNSEHSMAWQTLGFPSIKTNTKLVIGVGSDSRPLDQLFSKNVRIYTSPQTTAEYVSLKIDPQNPYKGTAEITTEDPYNWVRLSIGSDRYYTIDLKIYYAYQENVYQRVTTASSNAMKTIPAEKTLTVFPNPSTGQITLEGNIDFAGADIFVNNTFGKEVFRSKFSSKTIDLPAAIPNGIYFLSVQTKDREIYTHKIILAR